MIKIKDPVSGFSHLIGVFLSIAGIIMLLMNSHNLKEIVCFLIFGLASLILYSSSTVYHLFGKPASEIDYLRKIDHASIYFLIAGTFTPFCALAIQGALGYSLLIVIWILAILGASTIFTKSFWKNLGRWSSTGLYILMGWMAILIMYPMRMYPSIIAWIIIGGIFYTLGAVIYATKKPNLFKGFGFHELFHIFVLFGTISHFIAIYKVSLLSF